MTVCTLILCPLQICNYIKSFCFSDFSYTFGLASVFFNQSSKYIKMWYFSHKNQRLSVGKKGVCFKWFHFTCQGCCTADSLDIYPKVCQQLINMWPFQLSLLVNQTVGQNFTNSCVYLILVQLPGATWMCSYAIYVNI